MANLQGSQRSQYVRAMFGRIASRYDLLNRLMTGGQDIRLRKEAISCLEIKGGEKVLDAGAGTGDLALEIIQKYSPQLVVAIDLTPEMVAIGKKRKDGDQVQWAIADAQNLPFKNGAFDCVISGYLLRNVPNTAQALQEQNRTLSGGGRMASLDTTPPQKNLLLPFIQIYLRYIIPLLGTIIAGNAEAYTYLPQSTEQFLTAEKLAEKITNAGFQSVSFFRRLFGSMAIHTAKKPSFIEQTK